MNLSFEDTNLVQQMLNNGRQTATEQTCTFAFCVLEVEEEAYETPQNDLDYLCFNFMCDYICWGFTVGGGY